MESEDFVKGNEMILSHIVLAANLLAKMLTQIKI